MRQSDTEYRRGTLLGLTLAETLLILLFLFLLLFTDVIDQKDKEQDNLTAEIKRWREGIESIFEVQQPEKLPGKIDPQDLDRPLDELQLIANEYATAREEIDQLRSTLSKISDDPSKMDEVVERIKEVAKAEAELKKIEEKLPNKDVLVAQAEQLKPQENPGAVIEQVMGERLALQQQGGNIDDAITCAGKLKSCDMEKEGLIQKFAATLANLEPASCLKSNMSLDGILSEGSILYSFDIYLSPEGIMVIQGDGVPPRPEYGWYTDWYATLGTLPLERPLSAEEFRRAFKPFYDRAAITNNAEQGRDGRPFGNSTLDCRFYVRLFRTPDLTDVNSAETLRHSVENIFYKSERGSKAYDG
ncbi:hypothetical protein [Kordiimonas sp.]|uniref:hypothetical protein n=1 Tax=Kordiimonas sp. TaxID=1970157 RepID=UPI003B51B3D8